MRAFGVVFTALLLLAVIRQAIVALVVVMAIVLLWCVLTRPREMLGAILAGGAWAFINHHPLVAVVSLAIIGLVATIGNLAKG